jgi:plasmid stabilization system protein ParE
MPGAGATCSASVLEKSPGINVDVGSGGRPGREPSFDEFEGRGATMPQQRWTATRERQYDHIKEGLLERGNSEDLAEEIAARTVNKERARAGEARRPSRSSITDISSGRRGGACARIGDREGAPESSSTSRRDVEASRAGPRCPRLNCSRPSTSSDTVEKGGHSPRGKVTRVSVICGPLRDAAIAVASCRVG